jgi:hypothetical protein
VDIIGQKQNHRGRFSTGQFCCVLGKGDPDKDLYLFNLRKKELGELLVLSCGSGFFSGVLGGFLDSLCGFLHRLTCFLHGFVDFFSSPLGRALSCLFLARSQTESQQDSGSHKTALSVDRHYLSPFILFVFDCVNADLN